MEKQNHTVEIVVEVRFVFMINKNHVVESAVGVRYVIIIG